MAERYRAYPEYKDSGVEWLGEVPEHWLIKKLKYQTNIFPSNVDKKSKPGEDPIQLCNYTDVYYNDLIRPSQNFMKASATREQIIKFTLRACDTIITKDSEDTNDIAVPAYVPETIKDVICGYHLALIRPFVSRYGAFIKRNFETSYAKAYFGTMANGLTRYGLGTYALANAFFVQPPLKEAVAIAALLDHETAKIDTLIEKQQKLIALLKEKRQAVISHAVTKGLNPDAPMKDSGVEWLGDVPAAWLISRIKFFCRLNPSKSETINSMHPDTEVTFLPMEAIGECGQIDRSREKSLKSLQSGYTYVGEGDVCIAKITPCFENGKGAIATGLKNGVAFATTEVIPLRCNQIDDSRYLYYLLTSSPFKKIAEGSMYGAGGQKRVSDNFVANYNFPLPPFTERQHIAAFLNNETTKIDTLINKAQRSIELSKERRTALISAAVTGKIDVRNWQPPPTHKETQ